MDRAVRNDSATQRHCFYIVSLEDGQQAFRCQPTWRGINWSFCFFFRGGRGWSFLYSVRDEHTRLRPHKISLRPKKNGGFQVVVYYDAFFCVGFVFLL